MTRDLTTLFVALALIACPDDPSDDTAAWMACGDNGAAVWEAGRLIGLVGAWERSWVDLGCPQRTANAFLSDHRCDLRRLRFRAHPVVVPMRMPPT